MDFQIGDRVILKSENAFYWPSQAGIPATVYETDGDYAILVKFDHNNTSDPSWGSSKFELFQDGLERILEKI